MNDGAKRRQVIVVLAEPEELNVANLRMRSGETVWDYVTRECPDNYDVMGEVQIAVHDAVNSAMIEAAVADGYEVVATPWAADVYSIRDNFPGVPTDEELLNSPEWVRGGESWFDRAASEVDLDGIVNAVIAEFRGKGSR